MSTKREETVIAAADVYVLIAFACKPLEEAIKALETTTYAPAPEGDTSMAAGDFIAAGEFIATAKAALCVLRKVGEK